MMKKIFALLLISAAFCLSGAKPFEGPWTAEGTVFYLVHKGGPLKIDVTLKKAPGYMGNPVLKNTPSSLLVVMTPDEKAVSRQYWSVKPGETEKHYTLSYPDAPAGVWQIRNTFSFCSNMSLQFHTTPKLKYGVLFSRSRILHDDMQNIRNSFFLVPEPVTPLNLRQPTAKDPKKTVQKLHFQTRTRQRDFYDKDGKKIVTADIYEIVGAMSDIPCNSNIELPFGATEMTREINGPAATLRSEDRKVIAVLKENSSMVLPLKENKVYQLLVNVPNGGYGELKGSGFMGVDGFPVIFCPDPATARTINASTVKAKNGRKFAYRFQKEMYEWMKSLKPGDLEIKAVPIAKFKKEWFADPKSAHLLQLFAYAEHMFKSQVTDPEDIAFGTSPMNLDQLTLLYTLKRPYNPYYGNKALMNRIFLHYFRKWLSLTESGAFYNDPERGAYCGGLEWSGWEGMVFTADYISLALMEPLADKKLTSLFAEALELPVYRYWCHRLTCENQSLHWPLKEYALYMATKEPLFKQLANDYLADVADPALSRSMKTGYYMEAYGLDGTYPGISSCLLAFAVRFANDRTGLESLKKFYDFMSYTVVREPNGKLAAVNGFGHRTAGTWLNCQYGGGINFLDDILEEAAVVSQRSAIQKTLTEAEFNSCAAAKMPADLNKWCRTAGENMFHYGMTVWLPMWSESILNIGKTLPDARLPIEKSSSFEKNFNNEFYARRTPGYYTFFNVGNYDWRWRYPRMFDSPLPEGTKLKNGELYSSASSRPWMPIQGMNIFWTPKFGIFVSAHNWSMYTQNLVRADRHGKVVDFATSYTSQFKRKKGKFELDCKTKFLGLAVEREVKPGEKKVEIKLKVSAPAPIEPVELVEQLPFRIKPDLKFAYCSGKAFSDQPGKGITEIRVSRADRSAVMIRFDRPVTVRQGVKSSATFNYPKFYAGLLEIVFQPEFSGRQDAKLTYTISGDDK